MVKTEGSKEFTNTERELIISLITDYMMFRVKDHEMIKRIMERTKRTMSPRTFRYLKRIAQQRQGEAGEWLQDFAMGKMADFYRNRIEEMEYIQKQLLLIFEEEANKPDKKNKYLMDKLAKTIGENSKILADFGMAPPIITQIKQLLPVDINDLNSRLEKQKLEVKKYINDNLVDDNISNDLHGRQPTEEPPIELTEFNELLERQRQSKSGYLLPTDNEGARREAQATDTSNDDEQRVF
jgi:hypothetical protein